MKNLFYFEKTFRLIIAGILSLLAVTFFITYNLVREKSRAETLDTILTIQNSTHGAIHLWMEKILEEAGFWGEVGDIREAAIILNRHAGSKAALINHPVQKKLRVLLEPLYKRKDYLGYFIINADNISLASSRDANIGTENLLTAQPEFLEKVRSGLTISSKPQRSDVVLPDNIGKMKQGIYNIFIGTPIRDTSGKVIAVFTIRLNLLESFSVILNRSWFGKTGETYAFTADARMISSSRFRYQLVDIGLLDKTQNEFSIRLQDPGINLFENRNAKIPDHLPLTVMARSATQGNSGFNMGGYNDYRGVTVIGAWMWDKDLNFGIATEINRQEAFSTLNYNLNLFLFLALVIFCLLVMMAILFRLSGKFMENHQSQIDLLNRELETKIIQRTAELSSKEKNLSLTLNSIADGVIVTDNRGFVTRLNPVAQKLTGWDNKDAREKPVRDIFRIYNAITGEEISNPIEQVLSTGETVHLSNNTILHSKNGQKYNISDSAAPIVDDKGEIQGMVLVFNDVTEAYRLREDNRLNMEKLQVSEMRLKEAQRITHIGSWELDLVNNKLDWSDEIFRIFEIDQNRFGANYEAFLNAIHPDDRDMVNRAYTDSLASRLPYYIDHRLLMPDGRIKYVREHCETFYGPDGNPVRSTGTVHDITEQKLREDRLQSKMKMEALGNLTGGIAHDFNNILGITLGYTELLQGLQPEGSKELKYANEIYNAVERGKKLTAKLLSFSRPKPAETTITNINELLLEEKNMLEKALTPKIRLEMKLSDAPMLVKLDKSRMEDSILNIAINAMQAMPEGGAFSISTASTFLDDTAAHYAAIKPGDYITVSFRDTGCGMDENTKQRIFEPFFSTKGDKGTGLGMSQVYGFVKQSGGDIHVYSEPMKGTRVTIYLPRHSATAEKPDDSKARPMAQLNGSETILVVDDEPALRELAREILTSHGYRVSCATNGREALDMLKTNQPDLVLTDIVMPDMNGYQLVREIKQLYPGVKIQTASGFSGGLSLGQRDVEPLRDEQLQKPYTSETLLRKVREQLDKNNGS